LANQELPPGFQFLHCIGNNAERGESVFADGYWVAQNRRGRDPDAFDLLSRVAIPYRFHDNQCDIRNHRPLIGLDERTRVFDIRYNAHLADSFDKSADVLVEYYRAYRLLMAEARDSRTAIRRKLRGGEMVVFVNRRTLHGRAQFNPTSGYRFSSGFYVDRGEFDSRIRRLTANSRRVMG
jgi:gamma-butyrobetaine dioxygenase